MKWQCHVESRSKKLRWWFESRHSLFPSSAFASFSLSLIWGNSETRLDREGWRARWREQRWWRHGRATSSCRQREIGHFSTVSEWRHFFSLLGNRKCAGFENVAPSHELSRSHIGWWLRFITAIFLLYFYFLFFSFFGVLFFLSFFAGCHAAKSKWKRATE